MRRQILMTIAGLSVIWANSAAGGEPLSILDETPYQKTIFPAAQCQPGLIFPGIPAGWEQIPLNGTWKLKFVKTLESDTDAFDDDGIKGQYFSREYNDSAWKDKKVPEGWYGSDFVLGRIGWYRRGFDLTSEQVAAGKRVILDFRRIADKADVWVNGQKVGNSQSGRFNSVQFDITPFVVKGANTLAVRVYDFVGHKSYQRRHIGGMYEPVRLLVTPSDVYSCGMMVTTRFNDKAVSAKAKITNTSGKELEKTFTAEIANWKDGKIAATQKIQTKLNPGENWIDIAPLKIDNPVEWSPENPHLYTLTLKDENNKNIGVERFGFREFKAEGEWLLLNGKKFKPRMYTFDMWSIPAGVINQDSMMEKLIRLAKSVNVNMLRPHSGNGVLPETFFILCDEVGMPVYIDWSGTDYVEGLWKPGIDKSPEAWKTLEAFIKDYYSHPSYCMLSFSNELYFYHDSDSKKLDFLYGKTKNLDIQNRPVCTSTGRHTLESISSGVVKERTDVLDDHQYRGCYCSSWQENIAHIDNYAKAAAKFYKTPKPKIDAEYGMPGNMMRYRPVTKELWKSFEMDNSSREFKEKFIEYVQSPRDEIGGYLRVAMNYRSPQQYLDEAPQLENMVNKQLKRIVEIYRRAGMKCIGGHTNSSIACMTGNGRVGGHSTRNQYGLQGPIDIKNEYFVDMPLKFEQKRIYNPTLVSAGVFNQEPLPGSKQQIEIFVTNDLNESGEFKVIPQLRFGDQVTVLPEMNFGKIGEMAQKSLKLEYTTPKVSGVNRGKLELFLFKNGQRAGDNFYSLIVIDSGKIKTVQKVALYDSCESVFKGLSTSTSANACRNMGLKTDNISDFNNLDDYKYFIIGANSFDQKLIEAGEKINKWVKKGGRLLCFEQSMCGTIPFFPNYSVTSGSSATFVSMITPQHPAFNELVQNDLDSWAGNMGYMYDFVLSPLDAGAVAVAPTTTFLDKDSIKPVLCDVKLGDGQIIFSQMAATGRVGSDSAARKYMKNIFEYFLNPEPSKFALSLPEKDFKKIIYLEEKDALFVDLSKFANQGFADDVAGDGKGGWADLGTGFPEIPTGVTRLQGGVPFSIINPAKNNGKSCIVLKSKKCPNFPAKITGIPVNAELKSLYFLHTAMYAGPGPVLKYILHYANGATREMVATTENEIPDWWFPKDRLNATVVFQRDSRGLYMSEFINPLPREEVKSLDIESCNNSVQFVIAITGRRKMTSVVSGVGEK